VDCEIDPPHYLQLLIAILGLSDRVRIVFGDSFAQDLRDADVATCYLLQDANNKLERKFEQELRPGTRVISNTFAFHNLRLVRQNARQSLPVGPGE
jgi:hypothetical protein